MARSQPTKGKQRRALTGARSGGRAASGGDPRFAKRLEEALTAPSRDADDAIASSLTHGFHGYPARMHPATARAVIEGLGPNSLLDPFCGSGTTLLEAIRQHAESRGIDANPFAVRLAKTKTWTPGRKLLRELSVVGRHIADESLEQVKAARRGRGARSEEKKARPRTRPALRGQFPPHVLAELETLLALIRETASPELVPHLEIVLASILYKVSLRTSDTDASIVRRQVPRAAASRHFRERVVSLYDSLRGVDRAAGPVPSIEVGDARTFEHKRASIDLVLTSPPYPGTYNYVEHHQLRMDFLGIDTSAFARTELGARRHFRGGDASVQRSLKGWRADTTEIFTRLSKALRPDGLICVLVGDSMAGSNAIRANYELPPLAEAAGLSTIAWASQTRRALGSREKSAFADDPKREHLVLYSHKRSR